MSLDTVYVEPIKLKDGADIQEIQKVLEKLDFQSVVSDDGYLKAIGGIDLADECFSIYCKEVETINGSKLVALSAYAYDATPDAFPDPLQDDEAVLEFRLPEYLLNQTEDMQIVWKTVGNMNPDDPFSIPHAEAHVFHREEGLGFDRHEYIDLDDFIQNKSDL